MNSSTLTAFYQGNPLINGKLNETFNSSMLMLEQVEPSMQPKNGWKNSHYWIYCVCKFASNDHVLSSFGMCSLALFRETLCRLLHSLSHKQIVSL